MFQSWFSNIFIKIKASTPLPSNVDIIDNVFVGQTSGIKIRVEDKLAATATDPETLYVTYLETPQAQSGETALRVTANETLSGTIDGSTYTFDVQQENSSDKLDGVMQMLIQMRAQARVDKDFALSDKIPPRDGIESSGPDWRVLKFL